MRKKYLSALLFGALLFASAGTFTSCKDYDDDINGLREDVTSLQNAVTTLQNAVENGKYVSAVSNNGNTITFTFTDGTTTDITLEDEKGSVVTVNADGVLCIDGEPTDIKAATDPTPGEEQKDQIIIENNMWSVLQEDGTYKSTGIPVSGINVAGSEADGYTFTIYAADGSSQTVKLPSAASAITSIEVATPTSGRPSTRVEINSTKFTFDNNNSGLIKNRGDWKGNKALPDDGDYIYSSPTELDIRINPVNADASSVPFYLTNTKNQDLNPIVFQASPEDGDDPMGIGQMQGRAGNQGNGLWTLTMENVVVDKNDVSATQAEIAKATVSGSEWAYALNAGHASRSKYSLYVNTGTAKSLSAINLSQSKSQLDNGGSKVPGATDENVSGNISLSSTSAVTATGDYKVGIPVKVNGYEAAALYDMYLEVSQTDRDVYGITFDQDKHTFTIGKNPDVSTIQASFTLIVWTVANNGDMFKNEVVVKIDTEINAAAEYTTISHNVNQKDADNNFYIDLATMKTALGDNLNQWMQNVDLNNASGNVITYGLYTDAACNTKLTASGISFDGTNVFNAEVVEKNNKDAKETTDENKANYIRINVKNSAVATYNESAVAGSELALDKTYYVKVTFQTEGTAPTELNSIIVPVEFHAPALSDLFAVNDAFLDKTDKDVINAYFYKVDGVIANGHKYTKADAGATVNLDRYFSKFVSNAKVSFAGGKIGETGKTADELFDWGYLNYNSASNTNKDSDGDQVFSTGVAGDVKTSTTLGFSAANPGINNGKPANGYGETLTINVNKDFYNYDETLSDGWRYTEDGADEYSFKIRLMSPIYEGSVKPVEGSSITINANDLSKGASITQDMISGYDYNNNSFSAVPDDGTNYTSPTLIYNTAGINDVTADDYVHPQIKTVIPGTNKYFEDVEVYSAYTTKDGVVPGEFKVYGSSISQTATEDMPFTVTDAWGYVLEEKVPVTIVVNK